VKLLEEVERLETEVALMKVTLQKEIEYKENMEKSHHSLLVEQRDLQSQLVSTGLYFSDDGFESWGHCSMGLVRHGLPKNLVGWATVHLTSPIFR